MEDQEIARPQTQEVPAPADISTAPSGTPSIDAETILSTLKANPDLLKEEHIYDVPWLRSRVDSVISKRDAELKRRYEDQAQRAEAERQQTQAERLEASRIVYQVDALPPATLQATLKANPRLAAEYAKARDLLSGGPPVNEVQVAQRIWEKASKWASEKYGVDLSKANELEEAFEAVAEDRANKVVKDAEKAFEEKFKAFQADIYGKLNLSADQPVRGASHGAGGERIWTAREIEALSLDEWRKNEADIEKAAREGRIR